MIQAPTLTENVAQKLIREENTKSKISFTEYLRIEPNNLKDDQFVEVKKIFQTEKKSIKQRSLVLTRTLMPLGLVTKILASFSFLLGNNLILAKVNSLVIFL